MKKKTTIDDLAGMIKIGFDSVDEKFELADNRFDSVEAKINAMQIDVIDLKKQLSDISCRP